MKYNTYLSKHELEIKKVRNDLMKSMLSIPIMQCVQTEQWCKYYSPAFTHYQGCLSYPECSWIEEYDRKECLWER